MAALLHHLFNSSSRDNSRVNTWYNPLDLPVMKSLETYSSKYIFSMVYVVFLCVCGWQCGIYLYSAELQWKSCLHVFLLKAVSIEIIQRRRSLCGQVRKWFLGREKKNWRWRCWLEAISSKVLWVTPRKNTQECSLLLSGSYTPPADWLATTDLRGNLFGVEYCVFGICVYYTEYRNARGKIVKVSIGKYLYVFFFLPFSPPFPLMIFIDTM